MSQPITAYWIWGDLNYHEAWSMPGSLFPFLFDLFLLPPFFTTNLVKDTSVEGQKATQLLASLAR